MKKDIYDRWNDVNFSRFMNDDSSENDDDRIIVAFGPVKITAKGFKTFLKATGVVLGAIGINKTIDYYSNKKEENNKSANRINESNNECANSIKKDTAETDNKIRLKELQHAQALELENLKYRNKIELQKSKEKKKTQTFSEELLSNPLLAEGDDEIVMHGMDYFASDDIPKPRELYGGQIYENETIELFSLTNLGKTFFALTMLTDLCESHSDVQGIYYNTEMSNPQIRGLIDIKNENPKNLLISEDSILSIEKLIENMLVQIEKYRKNIVVVIDNLTFFYNSKSGDKIKEFLMQIRKIRANAKKLYGICVTVIVVTHANKASEGKPITLSASQDGGSANRFADAVFGLGLVNGYNNLRYVKDLKNRHTAKTSKVKLYMIVAKKPRFRYFGEAEEKELLNGQFVIPRKNIPDFVVEEWARKHQEGKGSNVGYGTIAREYFSLPVIKSDDPENVKIEKNKEFERCSSIVTYQLKTYYKNHPEEKPE